MKPQKWMGWLGILGGLGGLFFVFKEPFFLLFFSFFSFFAFFIWGKYPSRDKDESFVRHKNMAFCKSLRLGSAIIFATAIVLSVFPKMNVFLQYCVLLAVISLSFSFVQILFAYLTVHYDKCSG